MKNLKDLHIGEFAKIVKITGKIDDQHKIREYGLNEGNNIVVLQNYTNGQIIKDYNTGFTLAIRGLEIEILCELLTRSEDL
jgi:Fe2+ transport system protein FeoA